jgi:lambda repressor-like predicted transcriptional regulator
MSALSSAAKKAAEWTTKRDALIRQAHADGLSLRDIAVQAGMTHSGVAKVLKRARG